MTKEKLITTPERSKIMSRIRGKTRRLKECCARPFGPMEPAIARITENSLDPRILPSQDIGLPFLSTGTFGTQEVIKTTRRANQEQQGILVEKNSAVTWNETRITMQPSRTLAGWCFISGKVTSKKDLDGCVKTVLEYCGK